MPVHQSREQIAIKVNNSADLNKISGMRLDLVLSRNRPLPGENGKTRGHNKQPARKPCRVSKTEPLLVCQVPARLRESIPLKKATVKVNSVTAKIVRQKIMY